MGGSAQTIGYWYKVAYHHGICKGPIDAFLEYRGGTKTAWVGALTASGTINIDKPQLWGGEKDQGGIVGSLNVMFGEAGQMPNTYLQGVFGSQTAAWRGMTTIAFEGGKFGAMNPYPQKPSYKVRSITKQWDDGVCWYEAKAPILLSGDLTPEVKYYESDYTVGAGFTGFANTYAGSMTPATPPPTTSILIHASIGNEPRRLQLKNGATDAVIYDSGWIGDVVDQVALDSLLTTASRLDLIGPMRAGGDVIDPINLSGVASVRPHVYEGKIRIPASAWEYKVFTPGGDSRILAMNPAHMLVYAHTQRDTSREPIETINDISAKAASDWFYAQGFGLCTVRRPESESPAEFRRRIEKVAACSFTRSLADGLFYIDVANGIYDLGSLPILTDDDVLDFKEIPTVLDNAINSVSVKYFDPARKESIITPPVAALGLVTEFGTIHQTYDYPEVPTGSIAVRIVQRELLASTTPTRAFDLATTRKTYGWRQNTYFRLQLPKRGIADMVCLVGDLQHGQLKSGAIRLSAVQDVYSLPTTAYTAVEFGVDTRPDQTPKPITVQRAIEAPYFQVVEVMQRAEFQAMTPGAGFLVGMAADPAQSVGFSMAAAPPGAPYQEVTLGEFCPYATVTGATDELAESLAIANGRSLAQVDVGAACLWDSEICVVKAIDAGAGTVTLGRACADTEPMEHADGSGLFFYGSDAGADPTEYADGETVAVKLLTTTGSQKLGEGEAAAMMVTLDNRLARPYGPAAVKTGAAYVFDSGITGLDVFTWAHRDRVQQANMLVDWKVASIGPEPGVHYALQVFDASDALLAQKLDIDGNTATVTSDSAGPLRFKLWSIRDGIASWQAVEWTQANGSPTGSGTVITAATWLPPAGPEIIIDGGGA